MREKIIFLKEWKLNRKRKRKYQKETIVYPLSDEQVKRALAFIEGFKAK